MEVVAHRAGNTTATALSALGRVDMIELDVHVLRGQVEVRHAKVLRPTRRMWEKWYLLPADAAGVPIHEVLAELPATTPLMIDLKCFTRRSTRRILRTLPDVAPVVASTRNWWVLSPFRSRPNTRCLRSCGTRWQLWWVLKRRGSDTETGVCIHERMLTPSVVDALLRDTSCLFTWGATTPRRVCELRSWGITGVIVDDYMMLSEPGRSPHPDPAH